MTSISLHSLSCCMIVGAALKSDRNSFQSKFSYFWLSFTGEVTYLLFVHVPHEDPGLAVGGGPNLTNRTPVVETTFLPFVATHWK